MKRIVKMLVLACLVLVVGVSIAYYNTSSLGYDDANLFEYNNNEIRILDFTINYKEIEKEIEKMKKVMPDEYITI